MNEIIKTDIEDIIADKLIPWEKFRNKSVFITGATGMLPIYMAYTLLYLNKYHDYNIRLYALVRNKEKALEHFSEWINDKNFTLVVQDVSAPIQIEDPINYIIHAASQASPKYYAVDPVGTINANVLGTINTLNLAKEQSDFQGYLYFSSGEIYGVVSPEYFPFSEDVYGQIDLLRVRTCYCESKRMGEQLCVAYKHQYGIPTNIVRIFHTYGPFVKLDDRRVFADFVSNIVHNENIVLKTAGTAERMFCYVTDAIRAYFLVMLCGTEQAYNVANVNEMVSIRTLAETMTNLFPKKGLKVDVQINPNDEVTNQMKSPIEVRVPDISRISSLGWKPNITIKEGFKKVVEFQESIL